MKTNIQNLKTLLLAFAVLSATLITGCLGCCEDLVAVKIVKTGELPSWVDPGPNPQHQVKILMTFNTDMDITSVQMGGNTDNVIISARGASGKEDTDIAGSLQFSTDTRAWYFISSNGLSFSPGGGENVTYTVKLIGTGSNCLKRKTGQCLNGGADCVKSIEVVG